MSPEISTPPPSSTTLTAGANDHAEAAAAVAGEQGQALEPRPRPSGLLADPCCQGLLTSLLIIGGVGIFGFLKGLSSHP